MPDTIIAALLALFGTGGFSGLLYRLHKDAISAFRKELAAERDLHLKVARELGAEVRTGHEKTAALLHRLELCPLLAQGKHP